MKIFFSRLNRTKGPALMLLSIALALAGVSCREQSTGKPPDVDYYTCTMHPSVKKQKPTDKCPICSMDLVPVKKKGAADAHDHGAAKADAKSMGMSPEEHAKMQSGKGEMPGMPGMEGAKKDGPQE